MIIFPFSFLSSQNNNGEIVTSNLQLYLNAGNELSYPGSGTTWTDLSSNGYSTSLVNSPTYNAGNGGYFSFDGSDYVDTNQSLASETFSVGGWFRTTASGIKMLLSKETTAGWPWNYRIWLNGGQIVGDIAQSGASNRSISSPLTNYNNGSWYYVMYTRDESTQRLYVNGIEVSTAAGSFPSGTISNSQELWIGRSAFTSGGSSPTGSYQFVGDISEIFIYNRVLSANEILQNYNVTKTRFGIYTIESFTSVGTTSWTAPAGVTSVEYLVVAGGAGGGNGYDSGGGGGGAGGMVLTGILSVTPGNSYTVTVGYGGTGGADTRSNNNGTGGGDSVFASITSLGGIYGGGSRTNNPGPAGTGVRLGGAAQVTNTVAPKGGNGGGGGGAGGAGGGAGGAGGNGSGSSTAGTGGAGISSSISGLSTTYGAGGNGGTANVNNNDGASGGANTGKGGGGGSATGSDSGGGGNGGSGIVILKY